MKKHIVLVLLLVVTISWGQSNSKKEIDFKNYIETLTELKDGYVFKECSHLQKDYLTTDSCDVSFQTKVY
jgi:hypothetical protein